MATVDAASRHVKSCGEGNSASSSTAGRRGGRSVLGILRVSFPLGYSSKYTFTRTPSARPPHEGCGRVASSALNLAAAVALVRSRALSARHVDQRPHSGRQAIKQDQAASCTSGRHRSERGQAPRLKQL